MGSAKKTCLSDLPSEILFHVLAKLPSKSMVRCQVVSKLWRQLINEPHFIAARLTNQVVEESHLVVFFTLTGYDHDDIGMRLVYHIGTGDLLPSNNRIDKIFDRSQLLHGYFCEGVFVMYRSMKSPLFFNPLTRQLLKLPEINKHKHTRYHVYGLGFDFESSVHKVVCFSSEEKKAHVFTLGSKDNNSWRHIPAENIPGYVFEKTIVSTRGSLHWLCEQHRIKGWILLSFNLDKEEFTTTVFPKTAYAGAMYMTSWKGNVAAIYCSVQFLIEVWLLKDNEWVKEFQSGSRHFELWSSYRKLSLQRQPISFLVNRLLGEWNNGLLFEINNSVKSHILYYPERDSLEFFNCLPTPYLGKLFTFSPNLTHFTRHLCTE